MASAETLTLAFLNAHPARAARVLERLPGPEAAALFARLPARAGGPVLAAMLPPTAARLLSNLDDAAALALLTVLGAQSAVGVLRHLAEPRRSRLIAGLPTATAVASRLLLGYLEDSVGGWVDPDVIAVAAECTAGEALALARDLAPAKPYFIEAPCAPEDIDGLAAVAANAGIPVAAGEEWRNAYEAQLRLSRARLAFAQPEIAHTGISQFVAIAALAQRHDAAVVPHATIGVGIFMAASLHAASTLAHCPYHEYQPSVFDRNLAHVDTTMACDGGHYTLPAGPGLGIEPRDSLWQHRLDL